MYSTSSLSSPDGHRPAVLRRPMAVRDASPLWVWALCLPVPCPSPLFFFHATPASASASATWPPPRPLLSLSRASSLCGRRRLAESQASSFLPYIRRTSHRLHWSERRGLRERTRETGRASQASQATIASTASGGATALTISALDPKQSNSQAQGQNSHNFSQLLWKFPK